MEESANIGGVHLPGHQKGGAVGAELVEEGAEEVEGLHGTGGSAGRSRGQRGGSSARQRARGRGGTHKAAPKLLPHTALGVPHLKANSELVLSDRPTLCGCQTAARRRLPAHLEDLDGVGNQGVVESGAEDEQHKPGQDVRGGRRQARAGRVGG